MKTNDIATRARGEDLSGGEDVHALMVDLGRAARAAARGLARAPRAAKDRALRAAAAAVRSDSAAILEANGRDLAAARESGLAAASLDRLALDGARIESMAEGLESVARLDDPIGAVMADWTRPNGLRITRVRVPLGVIGSIYESRPNVTADAAALCLKSGNAAILRGGSDSHHSSRAIFDCLRQAITEAGLPAGAVQMVPTTTGPRSARCSGCTNTSTSSRRAAAGR